MNLKNPRNHRTSSAKAFNLSQFNGRYYDNEEACKEVFMKVKFPNGYVCEECGHIEYSWVKGRKAIQCTHCCNQTYLLSGTIFQDSKLSYYQILLGIFVFVVSQSGISGTDMSTFMGVNINTARLFLRKLREACKTENNKQVLAEMVDLDGDYIGGVKVGGKRGVGAKKQCVMVAVEMIDVGRKYLAPGRAKFGLVYSENGKEILSFVRRSIKKSTIIRADGGTGISVIGQKEINREGEEVNKYPYTLESEVFDKNSKSLEYLHKFISNFESLIVGTYHGVDLNYVEEVLNEFTWRFNNRFVPHNMVKVYSLLGSLFETDVKTQKDFKVKKKIN